MKDRTLIPYSKIEQVVGAMRKNGINAYWDGWNVVIHQPNYSAYTHPRGVFYNGKWGFVRRIRPRSDGKWAMPSRMVK
jgi:hypothetical protein